MSFGAPERTIRPAREEAASAEKRPLRDDEADQPPGEETLDEGRRRFLAAGALAPLMLAGGCGEPPPLIRVGGGLEIGSGPLFLARDLGFYDEAILRLVEMPSNAASLMSLATGDLEAATLTLDECLYAREGGVDVRVILVLDYSAGADVVMSRPEIRHPRDLKGRRIGVDETAGGVLVLAKLLQAAGLAAGEVDKVRIGADPLRAYQAGEVDALVSREPLATRLEAAGARRLFDSTAFPGLIVDVLAARADALEHAPENFHKLLEGYFQALGHLQRTPDEAIRYMAPRMGASPDDLRLARRGIRYVDLEANHAWLAGQAPGLAAAAGDAARILADAGLLARMPALAGLADHRFLPGPA